MKFETEFGKGDTIWFMLGDRAVSKTISIVVIRVDQYGTDVKYGWRDYDTSTDDSFAPINAVFESKEKLLASL